MRMTDFQKKKDCEQEIAELRHENQVLDERREKAELELLQVQKDSECAAAILRQQCQFAEQRIAELSVRESDLTYRLDKLRRESGERILSLEQEIKANDQHLLDIEAGWEAKFGKQAEALTAIIDSKQEELMNLQLRCLALSDRVESAEQDRDKLGKELSDLKSEVRQRLREDESKLREGGEEYERILLALNAEKSQLRHSLELAAELESRQQRQIEELTARVREGETRERGLESEVQRFSILVTQSKENEKQLQRRLDAAAGQAGIRKDDWEAERTQLEDSLTALKTEVVMTDPPISFPVETGSDVRFSWKRRTL
jgi:chromosome segregation ATPase